MNSSKLTIRVSALQLSNLNELAERQNITRYAMLAKVVERGLEALISGDYLEQEIRDIAIETKRTLARLIAIERLNERILFTGCTTYIYARDAALKHGLHEDILIEETLAAFERQRRIAEEQTHERN